ncbi:MAG: seg [Microgenomates group bacterium GW2011_GWC1_41_20]|uniref:Uncharacterized protein n=6 Tax=Candidatus Woeseibacteriota TaxID=1752722 RepID=A0A0G0S176_9BACT|nr:MAG: hypothetical protein UT76_C0002G0010 [Candidatus Woesebacteria bacterium GW2011_GWB1_40_12]KKR55996.1 MAG: hypothetical protein UT93_C0008G0006 [Candidatus Woesebacteria bacterium GW2011_GWF1_40_24]KKR91078.1 MAG: hypothetical protein UU39_C0001G0024 [Candidatus Woesebacteria bacterium GW2011_GWD1_41_12]KKS00305.1 MAG: seg [Microgenomates group bacterium GW2011_GWC1_41_20]KKS05366.1 MAG: hypothetical protein UU57_C0008G0005 [Candidatus Woesebacteria bacterium GW2011_GWE1_41_24]OGM81337
MPNQNQPNPSQDQPQNNSGTIPFSPQADLPPLPPEFQSLTTSAPAIPTPPSAPPGESGSAAPPSPNFSNIAPASSPKKKFGTGKIIATILGIFLLVGGVAVATYTVGQKQLFQQKASGESCSSDSRTAFVCKGKLVGDIAQSCWKGFGDSDPNNDTSLKCESSGITGNDGNPLCAAMERSTPGACGSGDGGGGGSATWPPNGAACHSVSGNQTTIGGCITFFCPNDCSGSCGENDPGVYWEFSASCSDSSLGNYCGQIDTVDVNKTYCIPNESIYKDSRIQCGGGCIKPAPRTADPTPTVPPTIPPTLPPTIPPTVAPTPTAPAPFCAAITTYDSDWNTISSTQLSALKVGDAVNFCVTGSTTSGSFDMARFIINGVQQADTTMHKPNSTAFCQTYTIPSGTATFTVSGSIHHQTLGWF